MSEIYLRVNDNEMSGDRILSGDVVLVRETSIIEEGKVYAVLDEGETKIRRLYVQGEQYIMESSCSGGGIKVSTSTIIIGKVIELVINT